MSPIQGYVRQRRWLFGKQSVHGTAVASTKHVPWSGVPDANPNWTEVEGVDVGSIDPILTPYRIGEDVTATLTGPLDYDSLSLIGAALLRGGESPVTAGTANTWTFNGLSFTATTLDEFTSHFSDDVTGDGVRLRDGIIESTTLSFDEDLGPWQVSTNWRWSHADPRVTPSSVANVGSNLPLVFGADTQLFIDDTAAAYGSTVYADQVRRASITIESTIDLKRYANGSNSRFAVSGYGVSARNITGSVTFEKQAGAIAESASNLMAPTNAVRRYMKFQAQAHQLIPGSATRYFMGLSFGVNWLTRSDEEIGGNSAITLNFQGRGAVGENPIQLAVINGRSTLP